MTGIDISEVGWGVHIHGGYLFSINAKDGDRLTRNHLFFIHKTI